jgi:hypothetical protein
VVDILLEIPEVIRVSFDSRFEFGRPLGDLQFLHSERSRQCLIERNSSHIISITIANDTIELCAVLAFRGQQMGVEE